MNILLFGPNGSGKGTQGAILRERLGIPHIESGAIFREHVSKGTELGKKAKEYMDRGDLVPDDITIPMILDRLKQPDCRGGWILDGFPRNPAQAEALDAALDEAGIGLDWVIEIVLPREIAKARIMGRRLCVRDNSHPNNVAIDALKPKEVGGKLVCRVCGADLIERADDQDETAIDRRHDIYYDEQNGTLAAVAYFKRKSASRGVPRILEVDGRGLIEDVTEAMLKGLGLER
ncbi:MAG TPA: adenylate kinase, partial [Proteobacteria bacterium]|nr:adenylate kinase [Pseudomonadota bacterium]